MNNLADSQGVIAHYLLTNKHQPHVCELSFLILIGIATKLIKVPPHAAEIQKLDVPGASIFNARPSTDFEINQNARLLRDVAGEGEGQWRRVKGRAGKLAALRHFNPNYRRSDDGIPPASIKAASRTKFIFRGCVSAALCNQPLLPLGK